MAEQDRQRFGKRVRALRLTKGWTQEDLAARCGLHPTYVGGIERGERNIGFDNIIKIAKALGCRVSDLFDSQTP